MINSNQEGIDRKKPGSSGWFREPRSLSNSSEGIDKDSHLPAYIQLARILRRGISSGAYPPGSRLPAEAALAKRYGVSAMTARQAVGVIVEERLARRVQGSGTYVQKLDVTASSFSLGAMRIVLDDQDNLQVRILKTSVERSAETACRALSLPDNTPLIFVERLILHRGEPFTLQAGYARFEPESPVVEMMLDTTMLTGLFFGEGLSSFKKGELRLLPTSLDEREAKLIGGGPGDHAFKLEHVFYDAGDRPAAYGWFLVEPDKMPLISRVGVWED